jgi:hypothetical protein
MLPKPNCQSKKAKKELDKHKIDRQTPEKKVEG